MNERIQQRLVDPEACSACYGCYEVCPKGAVVIENRRVAVNAALCAMCGDCVTECATGAIDTLHWVPADTPWSIEEQLSWDSLPPEEFSGPA
jgi:benzoyl-CoA 2,3-dioxygenase component A